MGTGELSLRTADVFPVVASLPPKGTTGNTSAVRRLRRTLYQYISPTSPSSCKLHNYHFTSIPQFEEKVSLPFSPYPLPHRFLDWPVLCFRMALPSLQADNSSKRKGRQHAAYRLKRYKCSGSKSFRTKYLMWHDFTQRQVTFSSAIPVISLVTGSTFAVCLMTRSGLRRSQKSSITFVARNLYDDGHNNLFYQCYLRPLNEPFLVNKKEPLCACVYRSSTVWHFNNFTRSNFCHFLWSRKFYPRKVTPVSRLHIKHRHLREKVIEPVANKHKSDPAWTEAISHIQR